MIIKNNKQITSVFKGTNKINKIFKGLSLVYTASRLPSGYQEVEYIQTTGTQYINTGYAPNQNSKMWLDYQITELQSAMFAGARKTSPSPARYFTINSGFKSTKMYAAFGTSGNIDLDKITTNRVQTQIGSDGIYYNNVLKYTPSITTFQLSENVLLFAVMQNSSDITLYSKVKIYACKIWENDVLVRDFIPCYRISDNVAGMYDKANNAFYTNDGTGTFIKGNNV